MFPEKYESTKILEDPGYEQLDRDRRDTLSDFGPDTNTLFAYEEPRRNVHSRERLNIREMGMRYRADPYISHGDFDISFHDHDPRGILSEQPWSEYRRQMENRIRQIDFKDDGDYSETSGGIHPNTLYKKIRGAQNWAKARLKIFDTSWEGLNMGGVGVYPNTSRVYRSDWEDGSVNGEGLAPSRQFDDPEVAQHHNVNISNIVNLGSKFLRVNSTTDQLVKVASYNKLYKHRGLINHENQLRIVEDDTPWIKIEGTKQKPRNLVKMMATQLYSDSPTLAPYTASEMARILRQTDQDVDPARTGVSREELQNKNRSGTLTRDIISLLGFTDNDLKLLESKQGKNQKQAQHALANIYHMAETIHKLPVSEKVQIRNELLIKGVGGGLAPASDPRSLGNEVIVNRKIVQFMDNEVRATASKEDNDGNRREAIIESEEKMKGLLGEIPLFVYRGVGKDDIELNRLSSTESTERKYDANKTHAYTNLAKYAMKLQNNQRLANPTQQYSESIKSKNAQAQKLSDFDVHENLISTEIDNTFGENRYLRRHTRAIGGKNTRRDVISDYFTNDELTDQDVRPRKNNAKNNNSKHI
jgi:hypothetical protein